MQAVANDGSRNCRWAQIIGPGRDAVSTSEPVVVHGDRGSTVLTDVEDEVTVSKGGIANESVEVSSNRSRRVPRTQHHVDLAPVRRCTDLAARVEGRRSGISVARSATHDPSSRRFPRQQPLQIYRQQSARAEGTNNLDTLAARA
jgi:hypothetical protein